MTRSSAVRPERDLDLAAEIARDRDLLEHDAIVGADGRDAQAALIEDQRARRHADRGFGVRQLEAHIGEGAGHQFAAGIVDHQQHARGAGSGIDRLRRGFDGRREASGPDIPAPTICALVPILMLGT